LWRRQSPLHSTTPPQPPLHSAPAAPRPIFANPPVIFSQYYSHTVERASCSWLSAFSWKATLFLVTAVSTKAFDYYRLHFLVCCTCSSPEWEKIPANVQDEIGVKHKKDGEFWLVWRIKLCNQWRRQLWGTGARAAPETSNNFIFSSLWSKSDSQLSKYCAVWQISWCRCQQLTALSVSTALVTKLLVIDQLLHPALKSTVSAPWHNFQLCPSSQQILATPLFVTVYVC